MGGTGTATAARARHHHHRKLGLGRSTSKKTKAAAAAVVIAQECPSAMRAHVLEVPAGRDVLSCVAALGRGGGALVLSAAGRVADVVLREPGPVVVRGTMEILSLAGCFLSGGGRWAGAAVFLSGPRGSVLGGGVALGGLVAAGPVVVTVATFAAAALDRLPLVMKAHEDAHPPHDR